MQDKEFLMPQSKSTITAELIQCAMKSSNKDFGALLTTCFTLSTALGIAGVVSCGIPFVPPVGKAGTVLVVLGIIPAIARMIPGWPRDGRTRVSLLTFGVSLLAFNSVASGAGQWSEHLIDYTDGH